MNLRKHILPRLKAIIETEGPTIPATYNQHNTMTTFSLLAEAQQQETQSNQLNSIYFKNDLLYTHNIMRINYTTYDVRRAQDTINPNTDHRDIMVLAPSDDADDDSTHQFKYARVLGIYHTNVIFAPPGTQVYKVRRVEFLWVRWFKIIGDRPVKWGWERTRLDRLEFPPVNQETSFGFLDPGDVLRSCHIIPRFFQNKWYPDGHGLSKILGDGEDWSEYFVNR